MIHARRHRRGIEMDRMTNVEAPTRRQDDDWELSDRASSASLSGMVRFQLMGGRRASWGTVGLAPFAIWVARLGGRAEHPHAFDPARSKQQPHGNGSLSALLNTDHIRTRRHCPAQPSL